MPHLSGSFGISGLLSLTITKQTRALSGSDGCKWTGAVFLVIIICVFSSVAVGQPWDGSGTEGDPYQIWDACDMQAIGADANYWDAHFKLMANIDLSAYTGTSFNIIGNYDNRFTGVFDGNECTISNFTYSSTGTDYIGLFGYVTGTIRDLRMVEPNVDGGTGFSVGALVGSMSFGTVIDCFVDGGTVCGGDRVGGLMGAKLGNISRCFATATVSGDEYVGGLVGKNKNDMYNCYSMGSVSGNSKIGGLTGESSMGDIYQCYSAGEVTGGYDIGGLVGRSYSSSSSTNSFWDVNSSGRATSALGRGKTTEQMQSAETFIGWGCTPVWTIDDGNDYPRLLWENKAEEILDAQLSDFISGSGGPNDPYLIYTSEELNLVGAFSCDWNRQFKLMGDIKFVGCMEESFRIIGNYNNPFRGVFDGNGHTISRFEFKGPEMDFIGVFGYVSGTDAEIKDLGLIDPNIDVAAGVFVGALVGEIGDGNLISCYVDGGKVSGDGYVGGLVGRSSGVIYNCFSSSAVTGDSDVGGLTGFNDREISNCYAIGSASGNTAVGGLIGTNAGFGDVSSCYSAGRVSANYDYAGGVLVGDGMSKGNYRACFWDVNVNPDVNGIGNGSDPNVTGKTTAEMQTESTFTDAGWDFVGEVINGPNDVWTICEGEDYPRLAWEKYGGGNGTEANPYLIRTSCQMNAIGADSNDWDAHFKLMADIDLSGYTGTSFNIIGDVISGSFSGVFDGNGHTISNFRWSSSDYSSYIALFGRVYAGEIRNLGVENVDVNVMQSSDFVAGLVGFNYEGMVIDCYVTGTVLALQNAGGLVGYNYGNVISSYFSGTVSGTGYGLGGVAGISEGVISNCYSAGEVSGGDYVGGLIGSGMDVVITNCYSTASVTGADYHAGGLVGESWDAVISDCYVSGEVSGNNRVGGLSGYNWGSTITNCYSVGSVDGNSEVGGLLGHHHSGSYSKCFWDSDVNPDVNGIGNGTDPNVIGETTANMQTESTFTDAGWDFVGEVINGPNDIWDICEGTNYPKFVWQIPAADFVCPDGVNFIDYAFFAEHWLQSIYGDCGEVELTGDGKVNWVDFALFAEYWKLTGCGECGGADFTGDENVDLADLYVFATYWLGFEYAEVDLINDGQVDLDDLREFTENWLAGVGN